MEKMDLENDFVCIFPKLFLQRSMFSGECKSKCRNDLRRLKIIPGVKLDTCCAADVKHLLCCLLQMSQDHLAQVSSRIIRVVSQLVLQLLAPALKDHLQPEDESRESDCESEEEPQRDSSR